MQVEARFNYNKKFVPFLKIHVELKVWIPDQESPRAHVAASKRLALVSPHELAFALALNAKNGQAPYLV